MKTKRGLNAEKVLKTNAEEWSADGTGNAKIDCRTGKESKKVELLFTNLGIEYSMRSIKKEMVYRDDISADWENIDEIESFEMDFTRFIVKIDDLQRDFPSFFEKMKDVNELSQLFKKYLTETNRLNEYVLD